MTVVVYSKVGNVITLVVKRIARGDNWWLIKDDKIPFLPLRVFITSTVMVRNRVLTGCSKHGATYSARVCLVV